MEKNSLVLVTGDETITLDCAFRFYFQGFMETYAWFRIR